MKNRPACWSPNCWLSMMLPPCRIRNVVTACTMPGRSGPDRVRTKSPTGSWGTWDIGLVPQLGAAAYDVLLELLSDRVVERGLLVVLELLLVDLTGPGGG